MALVKHDLLSLGRGNLTNNVDAAVVLTSNIVIATWSAVITYNQYNVVEYSSKIYRAKVGANLNFQPDTNPNSWETLYALPKDGDVCIVINGTGSSVTQRSNGIWSSIGGTPLKVVLVDGQLTAADALIFLGATWPFASIEYTVKRGAGHGRKRKGEFNILNDTLSALDYDHEFMETGSDVNVPLSFTMSGGYVRLQYTSVAEGSPIELTYILKGWI